MRASLSESYLGFWLQWPAISTGKTWTLILFDKPCQSPGVIAKALASCPRWQPSVLSQKFIEEVSPDLSGRKNVAHGVSRGSANPPSPPPSLPLGRERGAEGGVRALHPRACALGYNLPPLMGLRKGRPHEEDFVSGLLTQGTRSVSEIDYESRLGTPEYFSEKSFSLLLTPL